MRFVCLELIDESNRNRAALELYQTGGNEAVVLDEDGNSLSRYFTLTPNETKKAVSLHARSTVNHYLKSLPLYHDSLKRRTGRARTITQFQTDIGITLGGNLGATIFAKAFVFNAQTLTDLKSSMWWTVFGDDTMYLLKPERQSSSMRIINYQVMGVNQFDETAFGSVSFTGETATFTVDVEAGTVVPVTMDSTLKNAAMNKYVSKQNRIIIQTNEKAKPLDFIIEQGITYVIVSKKTISESKFEYIGVKESATTRTFSGADVTPVNRPAFIRADEWHYANASDENLFVNSWVDYGNNLQTLRFMKDDFGFVNLEGVIKNGSANTVLTFPVGYRPLTEKYITIMHWNGSARNVGTANVAASGTLIVTQSLGTTFVNIDGRFYAGF